MAKRSAGALRPKGVGPLRVITSHWHRAQPMEALGFFTSSSLPDVGCGRKLRTIHRPVGAPAFEQAGRVNSERGQTKWRDREIFQAFEIDPSSFQRRERTTRVEKPRSKVLRKYAGNNQASALGIKANASVVCCSRCKKKKITEISAEKSQRERERERKQDRGSPWT